MTWKSATPQLSLALAWGPASQFHLTDVETRPRRSGQPDPAGPLSYLDQEDAYAAGEVGFLARALVQATLPHSDPKTNAFVRRNGHFRLSIMAPKHVGLPYGRYPRLAQRKAPQMG